jgi:asparagine synthase (glutamine-hydrolysing)
MCGITSFLGAGPIDITMAERMAAQISHRGPDDAGVWVDQAAGLAMVHRRLAILELSPAGHQPTVSPGGRFLLAYNSEISNHADLRRALEAEAGAFHWRPHSDAETLLSALRH